MNVGVLERALVMPAHKLNACCQVATCISFTSVSMANLVEPLHCTKPFMVAA